MTRPRLVLLLYCLATTAGVGALVSLILTRPADTLHAKGRFVPTKAVVERPLLGAQSFWKGPQALAGGALNLGAWHGYHEVLTEDPVKPERFELSVLLQPKAWFVALVREPDGPRFAGVRLSLDPRFPSALLEGSDETGFERKTPIEAPVEVRKRHRLRLDFSGERVAVFFEDRPLGELEAGFLAETSGEARLGFRGGFAKALVDDVAIRQRFGLDLREGFGPTEDRVRKALWGALAAPLLAALLFLLLRRATSADPMILGFSFAMVATTLLILAGLLYGFLLYRADAYPAATERNREAEQAMRQQFFDELRRDVFARYGGPKHEDVYRILFVGSSQTWGSGVFREEETFVARLERMLNDRRDDGRTYQCVNTGIPSAVSTGLLRILERHWLALEPDLVIVDLGNNDKNWRRFEAALDELIALGRRHGFEVVLVQEPNSIERREPGLRFRHQAMERLGERRGVPVVAMHRHLAARADDGFLWWDKVHLTPYGNRLFAEHLYDRLSETVLAADRATASPRS